MTSTLPTTEAVPAPPPARRNGMGSHHSAAAQSEVWLTPPEILETLGSFDLDPCAAPPPRPWDTAARHIALPEDGLAADWKGRVWCNPPYGNQAVKWLRKLADHGQGTALIFARTETAMFVETVWRRASAVLFLHGRLYFHHNDGSRAGNNSGAPSALIAYGTSDAEILRKANLDGTFVDLSTVTHTAAGQRPLSDPKR